MEYSAIVLCVLFVYLVIGIFPSNSYIGKESFLIANRQLGPIQSGLSTVASKIGAGLLVTYSALFFTFGVSAILFFVGAIVGYFIFYFFVKKLLKSDERTKPIYSLSDLFREKYSNHVSVTLSGLISFSMFGWVLTNLTIGSQMIASLTSWSPVFVVCALSIIVITYLLYGGFYSVIRTDAIQFVMIITIFALLAFFLLSQENISLEHIPVESISVVQGISFFLLGILFPLGSAELFQRIIACKDEKTVKNSLVISSTCYVVFGVILSFICLSIIGIEHFGDTNSSLRLSEGMKSYFENSSSEFSGVLAALWVVAFLSVTISSVDTFIQVTASSFVKDFLKEVGLSESQNIMRDTRVMILLVTLSGALISQALPKSIEHVTLSFVAVTLLISAMVLCLLYNNDNKAKTVLTISFYISVIVVFFSIFLLFSWEKNPGEPRPFLALLGFVSMVPAMLFLTANRAKRG